MCRGDVGVHLGGPEHHHHGQGPALISRHRSRCHPTTSVGRDDASWDIPVPRPPPSSLGGACNRPPSGGRWVAPPLRASQRIAAVACNRVFFEVLEPSGPRRERGRRSGHPRFPGGAASVATTAEPNTGWVEPSWVDQRDEDSGWIPHGRHGLAVAIRSAPTRLVTSVMGRGGFAAGRSRRGVGRAETTGGQRPR
jgi:hypothetical protein